MKLVSWFLGFIGTLLIGLVTGTALTGYWIANDENYAEAADLLFVNRNKIQHNHDEIRSETEKVIGF